MPSDSLNLLEWYAANRGQVEILRDPAALFALGLLDQVGQTPRAALQTDLGVSSEQLDQTVEKLYGAGFLATAGTTLAITPRGQQFLAEIGMSSPLPPTNLSEQPTKPEPPRGLPERSSPPKKVSPPPPRTPIWLWGIIGLLMVGAILIFGALQGFGGGNSSRTPSAQQTFTSIPTDTPAVETEVSFVTVSPPATPAETQETVRFTLTPTGPRVPERVTLTPTDTRVPARVTLTPTDTPEPARVTLMPTDTPEPARVTLMPTDTPEPAPATLTPTATQTEVQEPTVTFVAEPTQINSGECSVLGWQIVNALGVQLFGQNVGLQDSLQVCPTENTTYTLEIQTLSGETIKKSLDVRVIRPVLRYVWTVEFKNVPLNDPRVQDAIVYAIDAKAIRALVLGEEGALSNSDPKLDALPYDPKLALELLKDAGYDGQGLYIAGGDEVARKIGEYFAEYLERVQIPAKVIDALDSQTTIYVYPVQ